MIVGIEGGLGSGKTLMMARYLAKDCLVHHRDIYANFWLDFEYKKLNVRDMLDKKANLLNVSVGIDEITVFADCRSSMSELNKLISYFILQTRKRNVCLYYTTQDFAMVDKRIIQHTHIRIFCSKVKGKPADYPIRRYEILDIRDSLLNPPQVFYMDIRPYYHLYNTDEIIEPW
jgi:hypothetical protein